MRTEIDSPWTDRDQYLQSLYISHCLQSTLPNIQLGNEAITPELEEFIKKYDISGLESMCHVFVRGASTRFFNLPSARSVIERALRTEYAEISAWLRDEHSVRFAFDYFGGDDDPIVGYGIFQGAADQICYTKTIRLVLQRMPDNTYVLWTAYPLLAPREPCWADAYDYVAHRPATTLSPLVYYFFNCYLSVTSIYLGADSVLQGTTDFWIYEQRQSFDQLYQSLAAIRPNALDPADQNHLVYELQIRCLDETLPDFYVSRPAVFVEALQHSLQCLANLYNQPPD